MEIDTDKPLTAADIIIADIKKTLEEITHYSNEAAAHLKKNELVFEKITIQNNKIVQKFTTKLLKHQKGNRKK